MINCYFQDVSEHDMDMLFLEEFVCSKSFLNIFTDMVGISKASVLSVHSSKTDTALGESDMTIIIKSAGERIGLLIENKIDAVAMPNQAARYSLRGHKGIDQGDYDKFFVFIVAPMQYLENNKEASKYPNKVKYETILNYFENLNDKRSTFKIQQIRHAIEKQRKGYQVEKDDDVTIFWQKYSEYQKTHFPDLILTYNNEVKGSTSRWTRFNTVLSALHIVHKTENGYADLTFERCANKIVQLEKLLSDTVGDYTNKGFLVRIISKSAAIRINTPHLDLHKPFEEQKDAVDTCLSAVKKLSDLVRQFNAEDVGDLLNK